MNDKLFFVSGASGSVGSKLVRMLLERGHKVRAMVHKQDERRENLQLQGAATIVCDLLDLKGLRLALAGVSGAYFGYPVAPRLVEATAPS